MAGKDVETKKQKKKQLRHQPLDQQIKEGEEGVQRAPRKKKVKKSDGKKGEYVESDLTHKILGLAQTHAQEIEDEDGDLGEGEQKTKKKISFARSNKDEDEDEMSENEDDYNQEEFEEITEEDERALAMFMSDQATPQLTLADIIMQKIKEKEQGMSEEINIAEKLHSQLNPKVVEVYQGIGQMLSHYRSGKIPKAFKIIPNLNNWEDILFLTNPEEWSGPAMYQATRLFASSLNAKMAQRFFNLVLMPKVVDDITNNKKLNFHYYMALKKATFKPAAFYRGIILPLCESGKCSLKMAVIIGSIISKISIPVLHSAAAILKIAEMRFSGANSYFLGILLNKKYALPYRVIDAVANHYLKFLKDDRQMHTIWHRALLVFVQRYKADLTAEQKAGLIALTKKHYHQYFAEEVRRELNNSLSRGEKPPEDVKMDTN
eukprot:TRINITY_DN5725_c0_g1_i1.p1 TRINITY_DN5725_c0_g1~~TRINITY_DN5725_c0_g1_i1.p1  ORF type:complete len:433 (+),score=150.88 TRINITY_DN5725_c0_g1_i1:64-1362(+)